ncbi:DUF6124 family protein [Pseudomonas fildesensis]|uniref:DUF6124 family protein n=1 Tax=Pseudomonas fildesensis TaxID=1674920 RepID=UPI00387B2733
MKKITPNPPPSASDDNLQPPPTVIFTVRPGLSTETALSNASELLESATVCAYDSSHIRPAASWRLCITAIIQPLLTTWRSLCARC